MDEPIFIGIVYISVNEASVYVKCVYSDFDRNWASATPKSGLNPPIFGLLQPLSKRNAYIKRVKYFIAEGFKCVSL